ncbi:MAG: GcrA family cell cycle regulator [Pseudomonadota bacterium]
MAWNDERVELLKKLWAEGLSASQIASKMGGVTRNAVIGKVHRLGLSGRATPAKPQRGCNFETATATESVAPVAAPEDAKPIIAEPEIADPFAISTGDRTTVSNLRNNMCKWPIGDPATDDFHFCGQTAVSGKSYCAYHASLAFQPAQRKVERRPEAPAIAKPSPQRKRAAG